MLGRAVARLRREADGARRWAAFALALRAAMRRPLSVADARAIVRRRLAEREANFLRMVERNIYGHPGSPYLPLLKRAGCELGDLISMVRGDGVEETLRALRRAGVYVAFEEFKGRQPLVRNELVMHVSPDDFINPHVTNYYSVMTGGTTGSAARVPIDLARLTAQTPYDVLGYAAHDLMGVPSAMWRTVYGGYGINVALRGAMFRWPLHRWFSPTNAADLGTLRWDRMNTFVTVLLRLSGVSIPRPETVRLEDAAVIARWAAQTVRRQRQCLIRGSVSMCTRIALAAQHEGLDLSGVTFFGGGEPPTPTKVRHIRASGARWFPHYNFAEAGYVGMGCANPVDEDDLHFTRDTLALIQSPRQVPGTDITVEAFNFTSLLPTASKVLLNVESDDYGIVEERVCGCALEREGLTTHLREVRSFRKLTGEGMTLIGSDMVRILEEVLPARFGGPPLDYQLWEEEDAAGLTRLTLVISPRVEVRDEHAVIEAILTHLRNFPPIMWRQAKTLQIRREEPVWTARGKLMTLHIDRRPRKADSRLIV